MSTIVTRVGKGSALTWAEADANFNNLNTDKYQITGAGTASNLDEFAAVNPTTAGLALLDDATASDQLTTLGGTTVGKAVFTAATVAAAQQAIDVEVGVDVQAYDADTAKLDVDQSWTGAQRGTVTDNTTSLSFDMATSNNFKCSVSTSTAITFTNITAGQSGFILFTQTGSSAPSAAATTKVGASTLSTLGTAGTYILSYFSDGTNVYVVNSGALA